MISLEQVRALEDRVEKAVTYIANLREEGIELRRRLAEAQSFIDAAASELAAGEEKALAVEQRTAAAEAKAEAAEQKAAAAEELRLAEAQAVAGRVREFESRLADMAERVSAAEAEAAELSARAEEYRKDQSKIEEGIVHALRKLDSFEDLVLGQASSRAADAEAPASIAKQAVGVTAEHSAEGSGIAVKAGPEPQAGPETQLAPEAEPDTVENELDIF